MCACCRICRQFCRRTRIRKFYEYSKATFTPDSQPIPIKGDRLVGVGLTRFDCKVYTTYGSIPSQFPLYPYCIFRCMYAKPHYSRLIQVLSIDLSHSVRPISDMLSIQLRSRRLTYDQSCVRTLEFRSQPQLVNNSDKVSANRQFSFTIALFWNKGLAFVADL